MEGLEAAQAAVSVALSRSVMNMQMNMVATLLNGVPQIGGQGGGGQGADLVRQAMAAQGVGTKLDIVV